MDAPAALPLGTARITDVGAAPAGESERFAASLLPLGSGEPLPDGSACCLADSSNSRSSSGTKRRLLASMS